jgi:hypothetical protein
MSRLVNGYGGGCQDHVVDILAPGWRRFEMILEAAGKFEDILDYGCIIGRTDNPIRDVLQMHIFRRRRSTDEWNISREGLNG